MPISNHDFLFFTLALKEAEKFIGSTAPNPPVGACIVKNGQVLSVAAHQKAGHAHAEVLAIEQASLKHGSSALQGSDLYVTLEPCNHQGKTPPCTQALIQAGIKRVCIGSKDPNPRVAGGGFKALEQAGIQVCFADQLIEFDCNQLIAPFKKLVLSNLPWVTHKLAYRLSKENKLTMLPENDQTTFTSQKSLELAHIERKHSDAIITTYPTIIADLPSFTVRHVKDFSNKRRMLAVVSRTKKTLPESWVKRQTELQFDISTYTSISDALADCAQKGALKVLIEAGPTFSQMIANDNLWDERIIFIHHSPDLDDFVLKQSNHVYRYNQ